MSYCRHGRDSDVYVYPAGEYIVCCACSMTKETVNFYTEGPQEMHSHLFDHREAGDTVPNRAFERLTREMLNFTLSDL